MKAPSKLETLEFYLLLGGVFFTPLFKAPKNIFIVLFILLWLYNHIKSIKLRSSTLFFDSSVAALALCGYASAFFTELHGKEWDGPTNLVIICLVILIISKSKYSLAQLQKIFYVVIISTTIAIIEGFIQQHYIRACAPKCLFEFHSVGHVNHTAIYILLTFGFCISYIFAFWKQLTISKKLPLLSFAALSAITCILTDSRAAAGGVFLVSIFVSAGYIRKNLKLTSVLIFGICLAIASTIIIEPSVVTKQLDKMHANKTIHVRKKVWNTGLAAWEKYPLFGVGMKNYSLITQDKVKQWKEEKNKEYNPENHLSMVHGHSLYVNTLAGKGIVGLAALLIFLSAIAFYLIKHLPKKNSSPNECFYWGTAGSAWFITVAIGFVNTTFHHEHGLLAVIMMAYIIHLTRSPQLQNKNNVYT